MSDPAEDVKNDKKKGRSPLGQASSWNDEDPKHVPVSSEAEYFCGWEYGWYKGQVGNQKIYERQTN